MVLRPGLVVQVAGDGHQADDVRPAHGQQGCYAAASRIAHQHQGAGAVTLLELADGVVHGVDDFRGEAAAGPVTLGTGRKGHFLLGIEICVLAAFPVVFPLPLLVLAGPGQVGRAAFRLGQGQLQGQWMARGRVR